MDVLSESTLIPIGFVIVIMGGVVWLTRLHYLASTNRSTLEAQGKRIGAIEDKEALTLERLARIETKLDLIIEKKNL